MAEEPKHKTPAELGEAVGRKIEELFGDLLGGDSMETPGHSIAASPVTSSAQDNSNPTQPSADLGRHDKVAQPATPSKKTAPTNTVSNHRTLPIDPQAFPLQGIYRGAKCPLIKSLKGLRC